MRFKEMDFKPLCSLLTGIVLYLLVIKFHLPTMDRLLVAEAGSLFLFWGGWKLLADL